MWQCVLGKYPVFQMIVVLASSGCQQAKHCLMKTLNPFKTLAVTHQGHSVTSQHTKVHCDSCCKQYTSSESGYGAMQILAGCPSARWGSLWNNSSVMKGMNGESKRSPTCRHLYRTILAVEMAVLSLLWNNGFRFSRYTSQTSYQRL